jgi:lipopolysaccharide export system permease protein
LILILTLGFLLEETIFPEANYRAWLFRAKALSKQGITPYKEGFWAKEGHTFIKVEKILDNQLLSGVEILSFDEQGRLQDLIEAPLGRVEGRRWVLWSATRRIFSAEQIREEFFNRIEIPAFLKSNQVEVLTLPSEYLSIKELWRYREALKKGGQNVYRYSLLIWQKLAVPFTALAMLFLGLTFVFAPRRERGGGFRFSLGALIGLFVYLGKEILSHVGLVFAVSAPLVALGPAMVVLLWTLWRLRKIG